MINEKKPIVIDSHIHLSPGRGENKLTAKTLIDKMDVAGVHTVVSMGSGGYYLEELKSNNDFNLQSAIDYPKRIVPLIYFDPRFEEDGLEEIDRCMAKAGNIFKGIKIGAPPALHILSANDLVILFFYSVKSLVEVFH